MFIPSIVISLVSLITCIVVCCSLLVKVKQLSAQVKELESKESLSEGGLYRLADSLMENHRNSTTEQKKRLDETIKIIDERRAALENQMNMNRVMADTLVDAFKYRLDEAEKNIKGVKKEGEESRIE